LQRCGATGETPRDSTTVRYVVNVLAGRAVAGKNVVQQ
jgi:hypothetical protein